MNSQT